MLAKNMLKFSVSFFLAVVPYATSKDIVQTATEYGQLQDFTAALSAANLSGSLADNSGPFTVLAPTNTAFASLPDGFVSCLLQPKNKHILAGILEYHILFGKVFSHFLLDGYFYETLNSNKVSIHRSAGIEINDSSVITPDVRASNGVIHIIDAVLVPSDIDVNGFLETCHDIPETVTTNGSFGALVGALNAADLTNALSEPAGPFTMFVPTDEAFASLPNGLINCLLEPSNKDNLADILKYHIIEGKVYSSDLSDGMTATTLNGDDVVVDLSDGFKVDYSIVYIPDIEATNGVLHVIDAVLIPLGVDVNAILSTCRDIPETAIANGNFDTLVTLLAVADLVDDLSKPAGPFTVFAPTDESFASLPDGLVTCLLKPRNKNILADILKYHVLEGKVLSSDLSDNLNTTTLNGDDVAIDFSDIIKIDYAIVSIPDVEANNGVIHVIDAVLVPSSIDVNRLLTTCQDVPETAIAGENFETLVTGLRAADLIDVLSEPAGPFTMFAPTDEAFAKLPDDLLNCLFEPDNTDTLTDILMYHIIEGKILSNDTSDSIIATTLNGDNVVIDLSDGFQINDLIVSIPDIEASNGVIHAIDAVLVPLDVIVDALVATCQNVPDDKIEMDDKIVMNENLKTLRAALDANTNLETLVTALDTADLVNALSAPAGPFTVFAPTDEAFTSLPNDMVSCLLKPNNKDILADILKYHVVEGEISSIQSGGAMNATTLNGNVVAIDLSVGIINDFSISIPDIEASNGVIHVIQSVLVPPDVDIDAFLTTCQDIPETIIANGNFDTLVGALESINFVDALSEPAGTFTLFAPTNEAFASLPDGMIACLLKPENMDTLTNILEYHVVEGQQLLSSDLSNDMAITTFNSEHVVVDLSDGFEINDSIVSTPDLEASNGVVHAIDSVLIPLNFDVNAFLATCRDIPETAIANGNFETLVTALGVADLVDALSGPAGPFTVFAPTDEAFDSLPPSFMSCLLDPQNRDTLVDVLKYHVVAGKVLLSTLANIETVTTLNGEVVAVDLSDGVKINNSIVSISNVEASNGVIHVIDSVLVPPNVDVNSFLTSCGVVIPSSSEESSTPVRIYTTFSFLLLFNFVILI